MKEKIEIGEKLETYKNMYRELDESGGPAENGKLFEEIIMLEDDILDTMELPPAQKFREILWNGDVETVMELLEKARGEYQSRPIRDPMLMLVNAVLNRIDDPFNLLPMAGFTVHEYQLYLFSEKLINAHGPEEMDRIMTEMRLTEDHLSEIGLLGIEGIKKNLESYLTLQALEMDYLDEYLINKEVFDLDEEDMDPGQFYLRGRHNLEKERFDEAIYDFSKAIYLFAGAARLHYNRGVAYDRKGDLENAVGDYSRAIEIEPDHYMALTNRGVLLARIGMHEEALEDFCRAIEAKPDLAQAYCNRGNLYALMDRHEEAIEDYTNSISLNPDEAYLYCNRGVSYYRLDLEEKALVDLKKSMNMGFELAEKFIREYFPEVIIEQ
ncbi:MAG TPA: tetratricopeptide repeat protein [Spirochaetota bacterium]|nr:tetratricopeptide repeat protein [Spirochaetota bacterium]